MIQIIASHIDTAQDSLVYLLTAICVAGVIFAGWLASLTIKMNKKENNDNK